LPGTACTNGYKVTLTGLPSTRGFLVWPLFWLCLLLL